MDIQDWIIAQLVIDAVLGFCILLFMRLYLKSVKRGHNTGGAFQRPEEIIREMQELTRQLDRNLEEKKEISRMILGQLDEGLKRAEDSYMQLQGIVREIGTRGTDSPREKVNDREKIWSSVNILLSKGMSREEVAQHTGISVSEIDLLLKIHNKDKRKI